MQILSFIFFHILFVVIFFLLFRLRSRRARRDGPTSILRYPLLIKTIAVLGTSLFMAGYVYSLMQTAGMERLQVAGLGLLIMLPVLVGALEVFCYEVSYDESFVCGMSPWAGAVMMHLDEIAGLEYSRWKEQYIVRSVNGTAIRLNRYISGSEEFLMFINAVLALNAEE